MKPVFYAVMFVFVLFVSGDVAAQSRLDEAVAPADDEEAGADGQPAQTVIVCVSDNVLYGFCEPGETRIRRLGNVFHVVVAPVNGTIGFRVILDEVPLKLSNGQTSRTTAVPTTEEFKVPTLRRAGLTIELLRGNETQTLDYGVLRLIKIQDVAGEGKDKEDLGDRVRDTLRPFTRTEWTWYQIRAAAVALGAIGSAVFVGRMKGRWDERHEPLSLIAS